MNLVFNVINGYCGRLCMLAISTEEVLILFLKSVLSTSFFFVKKNLPCRGPTPSGSRNPLFACHLKVRAIVADRYISGRVRQRQVLINSDSFRFVEFFQNQVFFFLSSRFVCFNRTVFRGKFLFQLKLKFVSSSKNLL